MDKALKIRGYYVSDIPKIGLSHGINIRSLLPTLFLFSIAAILVLCVNPVSIISFMIFLSVVVGLSRVVFDVKTETMVRLYGYYAILAIVLYAFQYLTLPEYKGFSGAPGGTGTDDFRYFAQAVEFNTELINLYDLPFAWNTHPFSRSLMILTRFLPYSPLHLLDFLLINVIALAFIPVLTEKVALILTGKKEISRLAFVLSLFCPYYLANGLILMRDAWMAMFLIAGIYFFLNKKYLSMVIIIALCSYIRMASGILLVVALAFFAYHQFRIHPANALKKVLFLQIALILATAIGVLMFPLIYQYAERVGILQNIFFREAFVEGFIGESVSKSGETSALYILYQQPWFIRIPLGFLFFLGAPFLSIKSLSYDGILIPRSFVLGLFPFLFLAYFKWLIQSIVSLIKKKQYWLRTTLIVFIILLLVVSQMSVQFRHKTMLMPLFYLIVSYGFYQKGKLGVELGYIGAVSLALIQVSYLYATL